MREHLSAEGDGPGGTIRLAEPGRWLSREDLLGDRGALAEMCRRLRTEQKVPPPAAATYVAGWTGGLLARVVGFALATSGAGFLADAASVRWHLHPGGWTDRLDLGRPGIVVAPDHPWRGQPGVTTAVDPEAVAACAVAALVEILGPVVERCRRMASIGRTGLWNEVGDGLGTALAYHPGAPVDGSAVDTLAEAVRVAGAPWKARPTLRIVDSAHGPMYVARKGGCCLSYTAPAELPSEPDLPEIYRAFLARFPEGDGPRYCSNCSLRDMGECRDRQVLWADLQHRFGPAIHES